MKRFYVAIDNSNLYKDVIENFSRDARIDYGKLLKEVLGHRDATHMEVVIYVSEEQGNQSKINLYHMMEYMGYRVIVLPLVKKGDEYVEKGLDVALAVDMIYAACCLDFDTFILLAGDRDYLHLVEKIRDLGKKIEVVFFKKSCADELMRKAHEWHDLDISSKKFIEQKGSDI